MAEATPRWREFYETEAHHVCFRPEREPLELTRVRLVRRLWPGRLDSAIDVGCGDGFLCSEWARMGMARSIYGTDLVADRVKRAKEMVPSGQFMIQSAYELGFPTGRFELVSMVETLEHMERPLDALREAARVSSRYVLVTVPYREDLESQKCLCPYCLQRFHPAGHLHSFDEARLTGLFREARLRVSKVRIQCYLRVSSHPVFRWWPPAVMEACQEWARQAGLIQGSFLGVLGERVA